MAVYSSIPPERMAKGGPRKPKMRTQKPGFGTDNPFGFAETPEITKKSDGLNPKGRQSAASNRLDSPNTADNVGGNGSPRGKIAQGARKASKPVPKPDPNTKKARGKAQK